MWPELLWQELKKDQHYSSPSVVCKVSPIDAHGSAAREGVPLTPLPLRTCMVSPQKCVFDQSLEQQILLCKEKTKNMILAKIKNLEETKSHK